MKKMNKTRVHNVISFVKRAPVNGRSYTDMLKHVVKSEMGFEYSRDIDRGVLGGNYIDQLSMHGVVKADNGRYVFMGWINCSG